MNSRVDAPIKKGTLIIVLGLRQFLEQSNLLIDVTNAQGTLQLIYVKHVDRLTKTVIYLSEFG